MITWDKSVAPSAVFWLAIAALAAIACPTIVHRAILARLLAGGLICRKGSRANKRGENRKQNFGVLFHTRFNLRTSLKLRERFWAENQGQSSLFALLAGLW